MSETDFAWLCACLALVVGLVAGKWLEAQRWRGNASRIQRIESGGQLYKVLRDEHLRDEYLDWMEPPHE